MHPIKKQILAGLITNSSLSYSKLKPKEIESNLFIYHLKQLISEDLIHKRSDGEYELSTQGEIFADKLSLKTLKPRIQPKIITLIVCQNHKGQLLFYKRKQQPFLGQIGFPYGKIHLGETVGEAVSRELQEKTNLSATLVHKADVYLTVFKNQEVISQMFCHVFLGKNPRGELQKTAPIGECFWEKVDNFSSTRFIPGVSDIFKVATKPSKHLLFAEFTYHI